MTNEAPLFVQYDGEAFQVDPRWQKTADRDYVVGERYRIAPYEDRSARSHSHYFASINEAFQNLPEHLADRFPTQDHLRKWALIKAGYRDERTFVCASKAEAQRMAAFIKPIDSFAVVVVREATVIHMEAKSQSMRAMGKADFQASKNAVLAVISEMIGADAATLRANAQA